MDMRIALTPGLLLKNPVMSAAGTFGTGREFQPYGDISSLGAVVTHGVSLRPSCGKPHPRIIETDAGILSAVGAPNFGVEYFIEHELPGLPWKDVPFIPSLWATNVDDFSELSSVLSKENAVSALEINLDCPNDHRSGQKFSLNPVTAARAVNAVRREASGKPVIAKISPQAIDMAEVARAVEAAGADVIACSGAVRGMAIEFPSGNEAFGCVSGRLSGPSVKPVALWCVNRIAGIVHIPIIGMGGVRRASDVIEFILAGASAVAVGSANFSDPALIFRIVEELPEVCERLGIRDLGECRGALADDRRGAWRG